VATLIVNGLCDFQFTNRELFFSYFQHLGRDFAIGKNDAFLMRVNSSND